jgi:DNA-binding NarL/FixJ family response regulator
VPPELQKELESQGTRRKQTSGRTKNNGITKRQYEVLQLLAKGYSNKQIASSLFLTEHTVKAHISALFSSFQANNRTECVQLARHRGILEI